MVDPAAVQLMLETINTERAAIGAPPLSWDRDLAAVAQRQSVWMARAGRLGHSQDGATFQARLRQVGWRLAPGAGAAENVALAFGDRADEAAVRGLHRALETSPGHRRNYLNPAFRRVGAGLATGVVQGAPAVLAAQTFAAANDAPVLTGVAYEDRDGDGAYDIGEGLEGVRVTARPTLGARAEARASTRPGGGYDLVLSPGGWRVSFAAPGGATAETTVHVGARNVKADLVVTGAGAAQSLTITAPTTAIRSARR